MYDNHFYTLNKVCPCKMEEQLVKQVESIFRMLSDVASFVEEMDRQHIIGKRIWYEEKKNTVYITKIFACDCGGGCPTNDNLIGKRCHCDYYNKSTEYHPKYYCKCSAEFYRPLFAPLFGEDVLIEPVETVLSGDEQCTFAIRLDRKENKN